MATIFDVAKKANVSVITVSRLLNNPKIVSKNTSERIFRAMEDLNYQPSQIARSLVKKQTNTIGVIMPDVKNTFFNNLFRIIEDYSSKHGFSLLLCNTDEDPAKEMKYIKLLQSQRVDGLIIIPCVVKSVDYLLKGNMPFVLVDRILREQKTNYVSADHYAGAYNATEYLIKLGHKRIAVLKGSGVLFPDVMRYDGFADAMKNNDIMIEEKYVQDCKFNEMKAYISTINLFKLKQRPTAIFTFNSKMMNGSIRAIQRLGLRIPENISLVCFDQIAGYEIFKPKVTCVIQPIKSLAVDSISALINLIKRRHSPVEHVEIKLKPKLIIGDSCKAI